MLSSIKSLCLTICCVLLAGCWSANELTEISLATALAIDKDEDGYLVTIQVINPNEIAGEKMSRGSSISSYSAVGKTLFEAVRKLTETSPRKVNLSHLQLIVYGEEMAKEGIGPTFDFLVRDHELRTDFIMIIAQGMRGKELISILTPLERIPATKIKNSLESSQEFLASTKTIELLELVEDVAADGKGAVLNGVSVEGNIQDGTHVKNEESGAAPTKILLNGIGVFENDQLKGWLTAKEGEGFNFIIDNIHSTSIQIPCEKQGILALEVVENKTDLKGEWKNGKPQISISIETLVNIADAECAQDFSAKENVQKVEQEAEKKIKSLVELSIQTAKEYESDIFGFGEVLRRENPKQWDNIKDNWEQHFLETEAQIDVTIEIKNSGMIAQPVYDEPPEKNRSERSD
ncbi:Ger(x)C family spore germination protein [Gracilibacillus alcaliphilus]|uniref:Ger(x)C family spore germination protein n=1 Tax=Gracilibacillus alcaliphilus TaxID=1401441 RepID=UPI00195A4AF3|nr:Ger(x)C family spore germination protein [Gracilibacillus alcaliphilus]MBM7676545.1 spore germination protein KC [Gracilibacillus alcaliphilus]